MKHFPKCKEKGSFPKSKIKSLLAIVILALGAEISPYIGLREKWESPYKKKNLFFFFFFIVSAHHRQALMSV